MNYANRKLNGKKEVLFEQYSKDYVIAKPKRKNNSINLTYYIYVVKIGEYDLMFNGYVLTDEDFVKY